MHPSVRVRRRAVASAAPRSRSRLVGPIVAAVALPLIALTVEEVVRRVRRAHRRAGEPLAVALRGSERSDLLELAETLIEQAPEGIFVADRDGRYTAVNDAGCRISGYSREEILGLTVQDLIEPGASDRMRQEREQLLAGSGLVSEWELRRKDGSCVSIEVSAKILADGRWQAVVRDITQRKSLEMALRASHADLARAQSVANVGSWRLDVQRDELRWSDETHRIFGVPPGSPLTYETFLGRVHPDDRAFVDERWSAALLGEPYDIEHRIVVDGAVRWVREQADLEFDERGAPLGGFGVTQDVTERKRLEDELRVAEARSSGIVSISADAIISIDEQQRITMFNEGAQDIFGYSQDEVIGAPLDRLIPTRVRAHHRAMVERFAEGHAHARQMGELGAEIRGVRKSGEEFPAAASISKLDLPGGRILTVALRDITEQRRAEERLDLALRGADSGAWDWNLPTGEIIVSRRWAEMRGYLLEEIRPHVDAWMSGVHPADLGQVQEALRQHFEGVTPEYVAEYRARTRAGEWIWILTRGKVFVWDEQGRPTRMVGTEIDVTERKRGQDHQKLLAEVGSVFASSLEYDDTVANIARLVARDVADLCVLNVLDDEGEAPRLKAASRDPANAWVCDLIEATPADPVLSGPLRSVLETRRPLLLGHPTPPALAWFSQSDEHRRAFRALDPESILIVPLLAHGELLGAMSLVSSRSSRSYQPSDVGRVEDVALRAALAIDNARHYRTASDALRMRDDVLGIVAHDLRNPLGSIVAQASLLQRRAETDPRSRDAAGSIARAANRMSRLIQDLLDVTSMAAGRLSLDARAVPAGPFVHDVVQAQRALATSASVDLRLDIARDLPELLADRDRLLQVFENLIGNALKFTQPGGTVTVGAAPGEGEILFWVQDTGEGIAGEDLPRVFDRFWQAREGTHLGAGLGLPIVKGIVEAHGGRIWVDSAPGRGTTFSFVIPTAAPRDRARAPS